MYVIEFTGSEVHLLAPIFQNVDVSILTANRQTAVSLLQLAAFMLLFSC